MSVEATTAPTNGSNGTNGAREPIPMSTDSPPPVSDARTSRRAASRAAYMSAAEPQKSESQEPSPAPVPEASPAAPAADPSPAPAKEPEEDEVEDTEPGTPAAKVADPDLQKRLDVVQKAEKRAREAVARERETFAQEREAHETQKKEWSARIDRYESLAKRAKYDPTAVLLELGLTEDDLESAARDVYSKSKKGAADPRNRATAAQTAAAREQTDRLAQLEAKLDAREKADAEREQQAKVQRGVAEFVETTVKAIGADTPLVAAMLAKNPAKTRQTLEQAALYLLNETGETPDHADVVDTIEKFRRAELEELGVDVDAVVARPKTKTLPADETKTAPTLSSDLGTPTKPRTKRMSKEERRRDTIAGLERGGRAE